MPSVAHVTTIADSLEVLLLGQLDAIKQRGYDVVGVSAPGASSAVLERHGIRHIEAPFVRATMLTPFADVKALFDLVRLFRRERFTIVHTHTAKADLYAAIAARIAGVPIVITTLHGFLFHDLTPKGRRLLYANVARVGMRVCDLVLSQNPEDVETAVRERLCAPDKIEVLGNGIDLCRFDRSHVGALTTARLRSELGIDTDDLVVGYVGRLVAEKGVLELFEAMRRVRERFRTAKLLLVGMFDSAKADAINPATAAQYGIADACIFTGHRSDTAELYSVMDLCVLPSHREGFPRTPMEASAMELPVIATNIRGCRTAVSDGRTGLLVPVRDSAELAHAIERLLADEPRRRVMGRAGRQLALQSFDERRVFEKVLASYQRLLAARGIAA